MAINYAGGTDRIQFGVTGLAAQVACIAFWFRTSSTTANVAIASAWNNSSRNGFGILLNSPANKVTAQCFGSSSGVNVSIASLTSINDGNWHHVAFNLNGGSGGSNQLYIDGVKEATGTPTSALSGITSAAVINTGDNNDPFWASYTGDLAEFAIWGNRQLTADEIAALAKGFSPLAINPTADANLRFYAPLVRDAKNLCGSAAVTVTGTTVSNHPRVIGL